MREERPDFNSDSSTAFIYNPYKNQAIELQRKRLPIFQYREHVMFLLERNQIIILIGETGSGKSTQVLTHAHIKFYITNVVLKKCYSNVVLMFYFN